jgi:hypothetical protein
MSFYTPSGMPAVRLDTPPAEAADGADSGANDDIDGVDEGEYGSVVHNDGTVMQDLDLEEDTELDTQDKQKRSKLHDKARAALDPIETLCFSDESESESTVTEDGEDKSPEQWLQALAELRALNPRYRDITDAELLATLQGRLLALKESGMNSGGAAAATGSCAVCGRLSADGCVEGCAMRSTGDVEILTRWYEDVQEFEAFDDDES